MPISAPDKIITPWATSGLREDIPENADPVNGRAGFDIGFPPINMTPKTAGGIPPFGQDFNGIFFDVTQAIQFLQAGGSFPYDNTWATAVGGYPIGALVSRTDNQGLWRNTVANNLTDPEAGGAGWQPEGSGATSITMTSSNVTLTPLQAAAGMVIISGTLTANLQLIFPEYVKQWLVLNNTSGAFSITCKTASGTGVAATKSSSTLIYGDGTNIGASAQVGFDYLNTTRIDVASSATINLSVAAPNTRHINITGSANIASFTMAEGSCYFVRFAGAPLLTNSASLVTQTGANIQAAAGDTCIIRATAANVVEILCYTRVARFTIGSAISLSGTSVDVLSVPSWAKKLTLAFDSTSLSGSSSLLVQLGAGSVQNTGYQSTSTAVSTTTGNVTTGIASSAGMVIHAVNPAYLLSGQMVLINTSGSRWIQSHTLGGNTDTRSGGGHVSLSGLLDRLRFTTVNGTDSYDASGTVTIIFEG